MKALYHWHLAENNYHQRHQYVRNDGLICGEVSGSEFERGDGWWATRHSPLPVKPLGEYRTIEQAKAAVMDSIISPKARKRAQAK